MPPTPRRGSALLAALAALAAVGAALALAALALRTQHATAASALSRVRADAVAHSAVSALVADWDAVSVARARAARTDTLAVGGAVVQSGVRAWPLDTWAATALADLGIGGLVHHRARGSATTFVRSRPPPLVLPAALVLGGAGTVDAGTTVDGTAGAPPGWSCAGAGPPVAAVATFPASGIAPSAAAALVGGVRPLDAAAGAALDAQLDAALARLRPTEITAALTAPVVAPQERAGACVLPGDAAHAVGMPAWGDPLRPAACAGYAPVVHVAGDLLAPRGRGQGVLVVAGDLVLAGDFVWAGLVVVEGALVASGAANQIHGAVVARGRGAGAHALRGLAIQYAPCAVREALRAGAPVTLVTGGAWSALP